jgi:hypothetical protein
MGSGAVDRRAVIDKRPLVRAVLSRSLVVQ